ncbi:MAG: hypothetical protein E7256_06915 [Lachnospiraceae bacterium]|nr:hypothetical protein [Lachnospiraceae bacterium]
MKIVYRILILLLIFTGSLIYFGSNMQEQVFSIEKETMEMSDATLPYITIQSGNAALNLLHGYCSNLDEMVIRESITPVGSEQEFTVLITENESVVKKLKYEVIEIQNETAIEEDAINALEKIENGKTAKIKIKTPLEQNTEYVVKITLITDQSKRIYYYTRIKVLPVSYLEEKLAFVSEFQDATIDKNRKEELNKYLETQKNYDNTNFAYVTLNSSLDMVTYGELQPTVIYREVPTVTEVARDTASVAVTSIISVETTSGTEYYRIREYFRFGYSSARTYLYNYIREMESIFDVNMTSIAKSEFKVGITNSPDLEMMSNTDGSMVAFVHNRELWCYSLAENKLVKVFSFRNDESDFIRDDYDQHDIQILNMDVAGNVNFMVYGYMNRGEYEGRVGIVVYTYDKVLERIEEKIYIPVNATYQTLKEEIGDLVYLNEYNIFYISLYDTVYSYNLTSDVLKTITSNITEEHFTYVQEASYIAFHTNQDPAKNTGITILDLNKGQTSEVKAGSGEIISLLGTIDSNLIYGYAREEDIAITSDGEAIIPMYEVQIVTKGGTILKRYTKEGSYITGIQVENNVVKLERVKKDASAVNGYMPQEDDYILNQGNVEVSQFGITKRITDLMLTEYYISLSAGYTMEDIPSVETTKNTIITEDTTVRINQLGDMSDYYFTYSFGYVKGLFRTAGEAVAVADANVGTVIGGNGKVIWERGAKQTKAVIEGITPVYAENGINSMQACLKMMLQYKASDGRNTLYQAKKELVTEYLSQYMKAIPLNLTGSTLEEVLYYISKGIPVIGLKENGKAVMITAYDSSNVRIFDPSSRVTAEYAIKTAAAMFEDAGNVFYSYID